MHRINIPLARPYFDNEELKAIKEVFSSRWVAQGPTTEAFEKEFAQVFGTKYAAASNSATSGLHLGLLALGIKKEDHVLVSDFTFPASGNTILYCGAKPIPVDVDIDTYNITYEQLEKTITKKTTAIMPVYALGNPPPMTDIIKFAKEHDLMVIEDSACAHGSKYVDKFAGTFGDIGIFSFHARKVMSTGEGGMAITNNKRIYQDIIAKRSHGMTLSASVRHNANEFLLPQFSSLGYNYRMSDITAAIGRVQLKRLKDTIIKRNKLAKVYNDLIVDYKLPLIPQQVIQKAVHNYQTYAVRTKNEKIRNRLIIELKKKGIGSTIGTYSLSQLPLFKGKTPNSRNLFKTTIALPMFDELGDNEIEIIMRLLKILL